MDTDMRPKPMHQVIAGKRYSTEGATLLATDAYWDGFNWERNGTNTFLFATRKGNYFAQYRYGGGKPGLFSLGFNDEDMVDALRAAKLMGFGAPMPAPGSHEELHEKRVDHLRALTPEEAWALYWTLPVHEVKPDDAFPNFAVEDA